MDYQKIGLLTSKTDKSESLKFTNKIFKHKPQNTPTKISDDDNEEEKRVGLEDLDSDSLERIACFLDSK